MPPAHTDGFLSVACTSCCMHLMSYRTRLFVRGLSIFGDFCDHLGRFWRIFWAVERPLMAKLGASWPQHKFVAPVRRQDRGLLGPGWGHVAAKSGHFWFEIALFGVLQDNIHLSSSWNRLFTDFEAGAGCTERHFVLEIIGYRTLRLIEVKMVA